MLSFVLHMRGFFSWESACFFWVCFECGQGHRGPMIPYCPGAP
ncbi:unnamed protein product, partial [Staurois parvus]